MENNGMAIKPPDLRYFDENRSRFPVERLLDHAGEHVAWSPDGKEILASGASQEEVDEKLAALGIHLSQVVHDYIDPRLG
jgi:hypothetical protein